MNDEIITSKNNDTVKYIAGLAEKQGRERSGCFLLEGWRAVSEALSANRAKDLIFSQTFTASKEYARIKTIRIRRVILSDALFQQISGTKTPQGIAAVCKIAKHDLQRVLREEDRVLILEDVRDPGNMGTVIRTAAAAGFRGIIASDGCVDAYNPKVVRSTAGCLFRTKIIQCKGDILQIAEEAKHGGFRIYAAHPRGGQDLFQVRFTGKTGYRIRKRGKRPVEPDAEAVRPARNDPYGRRRGIAERFRCRSADDV